jgi:hypothetical protein
VKITNATVLRQLAMVMVGAELASEPIGTTSHQTCDKIS